MKRLQHSHRARVLVAALFAFALVGFAAGALAADPPVVVTVTPAGDVVPGATITAKATVKINDGSTLKSIKWTQVGGVPATLSNTTTDTITAVLGSRKAYREELIMVLEEPPVGAEDLPPYVPMPEPYTAGLQEDRFSVVGIAPLALEHAGALEFEIEVVTTSGVHHVEAEVVTHLPWPTAMGVRNVPIKLPVLLHGKHQASYNWALDRPAGSTASLIDSNSVSPEFTPDVAGTYKLMVTDLATGKPVTLEIHAGTWQGIITGQNAQGQPISDPECIKCHARNTPHFDLFTPWEKTGHAQIFQQNVNVAGHYSQNCLSCHAVGFDKNVANGGMDDAADFAGLAASGLIEHGAPTNWTQILQQFPASARLANIQCENCHGPQGGPAHTRKDMSRKTQSSDLCGNCHGEPARHGRYQQWQVSRHGNYETARAEGTDPSCGKCHSSQGFIKWADANFSTANLTVTWKEEDVHPVTCVACHDPHAIGTTSGGPATNATVRLSGDTPMLMAGFKATAVGRGAICMTCHNGRRGLRDDAHYVASDATRAPHVGPQADVLMGQNLYFAEVGVKGNHAAIEDSCVTCHMESTPPPGTLSYNYGGTNHTFFAKPEICSKCHSAITLASVQEPVEAKLHALQLGIQTALKNLMQQQIRAGNKIDLGGQKTIKNASDIEEVEFIESHGRQGVSVTLADGSHVADLSLASVKVVRPAGAPVELYSVADPALPKSGWNYFMVHSDKSKGAHNPAFVNAALDVSVFAIQQMNNASAAAASGRNPAAAIGGGLGNGAGAVACSTPYVYWTQIASHTAGSAGSEWRTDLIARNLATSTATLGFNLHHAGGKLTGASTIDGSSQKAFEDIVATLGGQSTAGSLEICSDEPLLVTARIFNQSGNGSFGQNLEGRIANLGYNAGETVSLIGLRQKTSEYRSNIVITNSGTTEAQVAISLFDAAGKALTSYNLTVPAGQAFQDGEPFKARANAPDLGWGFATVTVLKGSNVHAVGSMIDNRTNDPTTIEAKQ